MDMGLTELSRCGPGVHVLSILAAIRSCDAAWIQESLTDSAYKLSVKVSPALEEMQTNSEQDGLEILQVLTSRSKGELWK